MIGRVGGVAVIAAGVRCDADDAPFGGRVDEHCFVLAANFVVGCEFVARPTDLGDRLQRTVRGAQPHASAHGRKRANALVENRAIKLSGCDRGASQLAKSGEYLFQLLPSVRLRIASAVGTARRVVGRRKMRRHITSVYPPAWIAQLAWLASCSRLNPGDDVTAIIHGTTRANRAAPNSESARRLRPLLSSASRTKNPVKSQLFLR